MGATAGKQITITLTEPPPLFKNGMLMRIAKKKRVWGEVTDTENGFGFDDEPDAPTTSMTVKSVYRPAPKSRLNHKGKFSKFKMKIIKLNT